MNERIQALAEQAGLNVESWMTNPPKSFQILGSTEQFEKFAELIVRECINVALNEIASDENISDAKEEWKHYLRGYNGGIMDSIYAVQQHFGSE
jgi:hypothetical protein